MKIRDTLHETIDSLDADALQSVYAHVQELLQRNEAQAPPLAPTLAEVLALTSEDSGNWADELSAEREAQG